MAIGIKLTNGIFFVVSRRPGLTANDRLRLEIDVYLKAKYLKTTTNMWFRLSDRPQIFHQIFVDSTIF